MASLRFTALASLGIAVFIGCSDSSPQSWEGSKSDHGSKNDAIAKNDNPKSGDAKGGNDTNGNDDAKGNDDANGNNVAKEGGNSDPHLGMADPHAGMQMPTQDAGEAPENNGKLDIDGTQWTVPKSWVRKSPFMPSINHAEYAIPKADGDKVDGRLTMGPTGGDVDSNVDRWKRQFGGNPDKESKDTIDAGGTKITLVDLGGTYNDSMGPSQGTIADCRMLGAIFQTGDGPTATLHFVKFYGPKKTIGEHAEEFKDFLKSLKVGK